MAKILEFPSQRLQGLSFLEQQIREMMSSRGADEELVEFAATTLKTIYQRSADAENYSFSLPLPEGIADDDANQLQRDIQTAVEQIRSENHAVIIRLIAELVLSEVKNFQYSRDDLN